MAMGVLITKQLIILSSQANVIIYFFPMFAMTKLRLFFKAIKDSNALKGNQECLIHFHKISIKFNSGE